MDVACSTACFADLTLEAALRKMAELEFAKVDLVVAPDGPHLTPKSLCEDLTAAAGQLRRGALNTYAVISMPMPIATNQEMQQLDCAAHLAKNIGAAVLVIDASAKSVPVDDEVRRLRRLERLVSVHGIQLTVRNKLGTHTEAPTTTVELLRQVPNLMLTLDPSPLVCGPGRDESWDELYPLVRHCQLRDTGRSPELFQVQVGRGEIEYGRVVSSLQRVHYRGSLAVAVDQRLSSDFETLVEVRKLRLLLESLL